MAIRLNIRPTSDDLRGKSHWWGAPDLPKGMPYPYVEVNDGSEPYDEPLTFICQIRLAELAEADKDNLLPHTGMLYFFAAIDSFLGEDSPLLLPGSGYAGELVRVVYSEEENDLEPYEIHWYGTDESIFRAAEAIEFLADDAQTGDGMLMLCRPYADEVSEQYPDHVTLLQVDEEDRWNLRFYDCGTLFFMIDKDALRQRQFDRVTTELYYL
ncbi:MAG: DUF1963 domain-containing protein [Bacteroidaceae bacterium]|nr:DUF1963 domain-containing protein [Bacteroidaceae bacterium]